MKEEKTLSMMSAWPTKHEFQHPLVVSNLQVWPRETNFSPQLAGKAGPGLLKNVKLQMQLYGNKQGMCASMCTHYAMESLLLNDDTSYNEDIS